MCRPLACLLLFLLTFASARPLGATSLAPVDFDYLVKEAEVVVLAETLSVESRWTGAGDARHIATFARVRVVEAAKGAPPAEMVLQFSGGTVDGETMTVSGLPQLSPGRREILFIRGNGTHLCPLVGFWHGRLAVLESRAGGTARVALQDGRSLVTIEQVGQGGAQPGRLAKAEDAPTAMTVSQLLSAVRERVARQATATP